MATATSRVAVVRTTTGGRHPPSAPKKPLNQSSLPLCVVASVLPGLLLALKTVATLSLLVAYGGACATDRAAVAAAGGGGGGRGNSLRSSSAQHITAAGGGGGNSLRIRRNAPATAAEAAAAAFALVFRADFDGRRRRPPLCLPDATTQATAKRTTTTTTAAAASALPSLQRHPSQLHINNWFIRASDRAVRDSRNITPARALLLWQACSGEDRRPLDTTTTTTTTTSKLVCCAGLRASEGDGNCGDRAVRDRHGELARQWGPPAVVRFDGVSKKYEQRRWFAAPLEVVALEETTLTLRGPGPFGLVGDSGAGKSTFLRLLCGDTLPSAGRVLIEAPSAPKTTEVSTALVEEGKANTTGQGSLISDTDTPTQSGDRTRDQPRAGTAAPPCGVSYLGRYWPDMVTIPPSQKVARVLADAFCAQGRPEKQPPPPPQGSPRSRGLDGVDGLTENLLCVAGLGDMRNARCRDLYRSQLLVLVLCIGVARAVVSGQAAGSSRGVGGALAATDQRERAVYRCYHVVPLWTEM
ncbi:unnamed protein product [Laminaria digitata]